MDKCWLFGCVLIILVIQQGEASDPNRRRLLRDLLVSYQKIAVPRGYNGGPVVVSHSLRLRRLVSLEEGVITLQTVETMSWRDEDLEWSSDDYGGIDMLSLPSDIIWTPDILLENNAALPLSNPVYNLVVAADGTVFYMQPKIIKAFCDVSRRHIQTYHCSLKYSAWTHDGGLVDLQKYNDQMDLSAVNGGNSSWKIHSTSVSRNVIHYEGVPYVDITYDIVVKRKM